MSLSTSTLGRMPPAGTAELRTNGVIGRIVTRIMAGQQARADRFVRPYLARMPASELAVLGFSEAEIASLVRDRHRPVALHI